MDKQSQMAEEKNRMGKFSKIRQVGPAERGSSSAGAYPTRDEGSNGGDGDSADNLTLGVCFERSGGGTRRVILDWRACRCAKSGRSRLDPKYGA